MGTNLKTRQITFVSKPIILLVFIFLLGTALYLPTLSYDFVGDDFVLIKENPLITSWKACPRIFLSDFHISQNTAFYRPLVLFSFSLDYAFYKESPWGYHLTNALLHGLNSSLVTLLALFLIQSPYAALLAGAFFALHPVHPEAVAFISSRTDLLATFFSLLALVVLTLKTKIAAFNWGTWLVAPSFFFLALLSKETAGVVLIPMAFLLFLKEEEGPGKFKTLGLKILPSGIMLLLYLALRFQVLKTLSMTKIGMVPHFSPLWLFELSFQYLSFLFLPLQRVSLHYSIYSFSSFNVKFWAMAGFIFLFLAAATYTVWRSKETFLFMALLILPCLPSLVYSLYSEIIMIERYLYLPSAGLALLVGWGILRIPAPRKRWIWGGAALLLLLYGGVTLWRMPLWRDELVLYQALKKEYPRVPYIHSNLGSIYMHQNLFSEARQELSLAVELEPRHPIYRNNLGWLLLRMGETSQARAEFTEALNSWPNYASSLLGMSLTYRLEGNNEMAQKFRIKALLADPQNEAFQMNKKLKLKEEPTH